MKRLNAQLAALASGNSPVEEELEAGDQVLPLLIGVDGVMTPFRPEGGMPTGVRRESVLSDCSAQQCVSNLLFHQQYPKR
jgi:hypothetical protein